MSNQFRPIRFDSDMFRDLIDYKSELTEQSKIWPEFLPDPTPPTPQFNYEIGEYVAGEGGVIAHRWLSNVAYGPVVSDGTIQNYIVVDTNDIVQATINWESGITAVVGLSLFDGQLNTDAIIAQAISPLAAIYCNSSTNNGKSDWYLPSISEMVTIGANLFNISKGIEDAGGGQFNAVASNVGYWVSNQASNTFAFVYNFATSSTVLTSKGSLTQKLRAVRKFSV